MIPDETFHRRKASRLAEQIKQETAESLLVFDPLNIRYITGLITPGTSRPIALVIRPDASLTLFAHQLDAELLGSTVVSDVQSYNGDGEASEAIRWIAKNIETPVLIDSLPSKYWNEMIDALPGDSEEHDESDENADEESSPEASDVDSIAQRIRHTTMIEEMRLIKDPAEISLLEQAAGFADLGLERAYARLTVGVSEYEVAVEVESAVLEAIRAESGDTFERAAPEVSLSIASGTRAAIPEARTSTRQLSRGDLVIAECTVSIGGYHAVAGSTFFVGDPLRDAVAWVESALNAQKAVRAALKPGVTGCQLNEAGHKVLKDAGITTPARHSVVSGTGLSRDEGPLLGENQSEALKSGMVIVNRPGVYISGRTGTRHAETVLITDSGHRLLNPRIDRWDDLEGRLKEF